MLQERVFLPRAGRRKGDVAPMQTISIIGSEGCLGRALRRALADGFAVRRVDIVGTFNVLQACLRNGVRRVVWASSTAALSKQGIYCITKVLGEDLCDYYHETHGVQIAMMRYGAFTACDLVTYGQRLLRHAVDLIERYGIEVPRSIARHDLSSTQRDLAFVPRYDLETFLGELREKDACGAVTPESPRWCFETGRPPVEDVVWPEQEALVQPHAHGS